MTAERAIPTNDEETMMSNVTIDPKRLARVSRLAQGSHDVNDSDTYCLLEAVAWVAGEPWSDQPRCVCPTLSAFGRSFNDGIRDEQTRTELLVPFVARLVGTARPDDPTVAGRRSLMALDWLVRTHTPAWLRLAGLHDEAESLVALDAIVDLDTARKAGPVVCDASSQAAAAWEASRGAARGAAWGAARGAAFSAAWAAAMDSARDAAFAAAWDAAWDAARAAAWAAATSGGWATVQDVLAPTITELQASAVDLLGRMILVAPGPFGGPDA